MLRAGVAAVIKFFESFAGLGSKIVELVEGLLSSIFGIVKNAGEAIIDGLKMMILFLSATKEKLIEFFSKLFEGFKVIFGIGFKPEIEEIFERLGITWEKKIIPALNSGVPVLLGESKWGIYHNGHLIMEGSKEEIEAFASGLKGMSEQAAEEVLDAAAKKWIEENAPRIAESLKTFAQQNGLHEGIDMLSVVRMGGGRTELCESILLSTKEVVEGKSVEELVEHFHIPETPAANSLSNYRARIWYSWKKAHIEEIIGKISGLKEKAMKAFELRNEYRAAAREFMQDRELVEHLNLTEKNLQWENYLSIKSKSFKGDALWNEIIRSSQTGRDFVDDLFQIK